MSKLSSAPSFITGSLIFLSAFIARLGSLGRIVTPDEYAWVNRSIQFRKALLTTNWEQTIQAPHPGVIPTWLTTIGIQLTLLFNPDTYSNLAIAENLAWAHGPSGEVYIHLIPFLTSGRLLMISVFALGIVCIYFLLKKQFGQTAALLAAFFLALDPWLVGLSSVLHVDALMALFSCLSILIILTAKTLDSKRLALAGFTTALAILSKLPGIVLLGVVPILIIGLNIYRKSFTISQIVQQVAIWAITLAISAAMLLPALLTNPAGVFDLIFANSSQEVSIQIPIFFMGEMRSELGAIFYPLTLFIRQSPLVTVGLLLACWQLFFKFSSNKGLWSGVFAGVSLLFWLGISLSSREFTRYMAPTSILLIIAAGVSIGKTLEPRPIQSQKILLPSLLILQFGWMVWFWTTPLSAANLFSGGPWQLQNQVPIGWADGVSQGAAYAAAQPNAGNKRLFTTNVPAAAAFFPGEVLRFTPETSNLIRPTDFVLIDGNTVQIEGNRSSFQEKEPFHTVKLNGVETAWLFSDWAGESNTKSQNDQIRFGESLSLNRSIIFQPSDQNTIVLQTVWESSIQQNYQLISKIIDTEGNIWSSIESPLIANSGLPTSAWPLGQEEHFFTSHNLPNDMPPQSYSVSLELFDNSGKRLGVFKQNGQFQGIQSKIGTVQYSPQPNFSLTAMPNTIKLNDSDLLMIDVPPTILGQGDTIRLETWIQNNQLSGQNLTLLINDQPLDFEFSTSAWPQDSIFKVKAQWQLPADFPPGDWPAAIQLSSAQVEIGSIHVEERDRLFELPSGITPIGVQLQDAALLQQLNVRIDKSFIIESIWQSQSSHLADYTMFLHLKDSAGNIVSQIDRSPSKPTSQWIEDEIILDEITMPLNETVSQVAIGLYDPQTGQRIPVFSADGTQLPNDQFVLDLNR